MKKTIILMFSIIVLIFNLKAQDEASYFLAENNKIIWQKVFQTEMDFNQLTERVKESGILADIEIGEDKILGQTKSIDADYKGAGYGEMRAPIYVVRSFIDGYAVIELKDGRYRVTLRNIMLTQKYDDGLTDEGEKSTLESWAMKRGKNQIKRGFLKSSSEILNHTFTHVFDFRALDKDDNW